MNNPGNKLLKDLAKLTSGIVTLTGIHSYYLTYINQGKSEEQNINMLNKMEETNKLIESSINKNNLNEEKLDNVVHKVQSLKEKVDIMVALRKEEQEKSTSLIDYFSKNKDVDFNKDFNLIKKELDEICELYPVERAKVLNQVGSSSDNLNNGNNLINNFLNNNNNNNSL
jgi:diacylglycerol kinase family enzyme